MYILSIITFIGKGPLLKYLQYLFIPTLDKLFCGSQTRWYLYDIFCKQFTFLQPLTLLTQLQELDNQENRKPVESLQDIYTKDLEFYDFINKVLHLKHLQ